MPHKNSDVTIEVRRKINEVMKHFKVNECLLCGQLNPQFCNSHSVPQFILKNIAKDGYIRTSNELIDVDLLGLFDNQKGVNNSGTFHNICRICDSNVFKDYESEESLLKRPTENMLLEILLKNILYRINKKYREKGIYNYTETDFNITHPASLFHGIDLQEDFVQLNKIKNSLSGKKKIYFNLFFWEKLQYIVPVAFQTNFYLYGDLEGNFVNNVYDYNKKMIPQEIVLCVFPLSSSTIVMGFNNKENNKNNRFISQFVKKSLKEKLEIINKVNLLYSEDYYLSPYISNDLISNHKLKEISSELNFIFKRKGDCRPPINKSLLNALRYHNDIPNLLSDMYKIR